MDQLRAMKVFARVIDEGGFAKAARAMNMAPPVVTRTVADLEKHLGARLLNRTTRRIALTDVGEEYLERARRILVDVDEAVALASRSTESARGHVRLLAPPAIAAHQLARRLPDFRRSYPEVTLEIVAPGAVETVDEDFDITILALRQPIEDGGFIARPLARSEVVMCASPAYVKINGAPAHPRELAEHQMLVPPIASLGRGVRFVRATNETETYDAPAPKASALRTTHTDTNYEAALAGLGIAGLPSFVAAEALLDGRLVRVLASWRLFSLRLFAAYPSRQYLPARTRAMLDFLIQVFGGEDRDPWLAAAGCESC